MQNRFGSLFIAALLPLLLFRWFIPTSEVQLDFWLMWLLAMVLVGLPILYAEIGLAHRSQKIPAQGIQLLTRQADTNPIWRSFVWLTALLALVVAGLNIDAVSDNVANATEALGLSLDVPNYAIAVAMIVLATILSLLGGSTLIVALALISVAFIMGVITRMTALDMVMTEPSMGDWARAVILALVSVGVGTGLYWFYNPLVTHQDGLQNEGAINPKIDKIATKTVLPIWLTQLVIGSAVLIFTPNVFGPITTLIYALGVLVAAAFFIHYASSQIATRFQRFGIWIATLISMSIALLLVLAATPKVLSVMLVVVSILSALVLAIFSGWKMKTSHMRKSLNFRSETFYNIWRISIRVLAPLLILIAIAGWLLI